MTLSANIIKISPPENYTKPEDIKVVLNIMDLGYDSELYKGTEVITLPELIPLMKERKWRAGNFFINKNMPSLLDKTFTIVKGDMEIPTPPVKQLTLVNILSELAKMKSELMFSEEYYKDTTSGVSYNDFIPNFFDARMTANNLIISRRKFNIVLTATIDGMVEVEGTRVKLSRYYPFKVVKYGELQHNQLYVKVDETNYNYLKQIEAEFKGDIAIVHMNKVPIFETEGIDSSINNMLIVFREITKLRSIIKSHRFYLTELRSTMDRLGKSVPQREWFNGESVDEEYISDEGTEWLEVWEKGKKDTLSMPKLLEELDTFGQGLQGLTENILQLEDVNKEAVTGAVSKTNEIILSLYKDGTLSQYETFMLATLVENLQLSGTHEERLDAVIKNIKETALKLSVQELKYLTLRWNIFDKDIDMFKLGTLIKKESDKFELTSPQGTITVRKGVNERRERPDVIPVITENIEE